MYNDLTHLTEKELNQLIEKYYSDEYRVKDIIEEYKLNIKSSRLISFFPPDKHNNIFCKHCNENMYSDKISKSGYSSKKDKYCLKCGHIDYVSNYSQCDCEGCRVLKIKKIDLQKKERQKEEEKELNELSIIRQHFTKYERSYLLDENDFVCKLYLSSLLLSSINENLEYINCISNIKSNITPTDDLLEKVVSTLVNHKLIKPTEHHSNIGHIFLTDYSKFKFSYHPFNIKFELNIRVKELNNISIIKKIIDDSCIESIDKIDLLRIWKEIGYHELIEYLYYQTNQYNLNSDYVGKKIKGIIKDLLDDFSISQSMAIIYSSVKSVAAYKQKEGISAPHAINALYSTINNSRNKKLIGEWEINSFSRNYDLPQSVISRHFFDVWLKIGEKGFVLPPKLEYVPVGYLTTWQPDSEIFPEDIKSLGDEFTSYSKKYITEYYDGNDINDLLNVFNQIRDLYTKAHEKIKSSKRLD